MKPSPLQLEPPTYPILSVRSVPEQGKKLSQSALPIGIEATVLYNSDGTHFAYLSIEQSDDSFPYLIEIDVFTTFVIDVEGCRQAYKKAFNPQVVAVNIVRILYSSAREMLGLLTSRAPHGGANLPSVMIEPADVAIEFERDQLATILVKSFGLTEEAVKAALERQQQAEQSGDIGADVMQEERFGAAREAAPDASRPAPKRPRKRVVSTKS